jgi:hypothetical protein
MRNPFRHSNDLGPTVPLEVDEMWNCLAGDAGSGAIDPPDAPPPSGRSVDHDQYLLDLARATGIPRWAIEAAIYTSIGDWDRTGEWPTPQQMDIRARELHHRYGIVREAGMRPAPRRAGMER